MKLKKIYALTPLVAIILASGGFFSIKHYSALQEKRKAEARVEQTPLDQLVSFDENIEDTHPEKIMLSDVSGGENYGNAARIFQGEQFVLNIDASLPKLLSDSQYYHGWLYDETLSSERPEAISLGYLEERDGRYYLDYSTISDLRNYRKIGITKKQYGKAEKRILEGNF